MRQRRSFTSGLQVLTAPKTLLTLLIGSVSLSVLGNAAFQLLSNWFTTSNAAMLGIISGAMLILLGVTWMIEHLAQRWRSVPPLPNKQTPDKRRGLIVLVSNEPTVRRALAWHHDTLE